MVELIGANPTGKTNAPKNMEKVIRVREDADLFIFCGKINDKFSDFKLNTGSDVTVINSRLVTVSEKHIPLENKRLRYPTEKKVPVKFRVKMELGKYSCRIIVCGGNRRELHSWGRFLFANGNGQNF